MTSERLLAFTDGVIAVIITIMVLEMKPPPGADLAALARLWPVALAYVLSFTYVAIYWNNHHHFFKLAPEVNGAVMWANLGLLFCLSLVPFATAWMGAPVRGLAHGGLWRALLCQRDRLVRHAGGDHPPAGPGSALKAAIGRDIKGKASPFLYIAGIALAFVASPLADLVFAAVAVMWLIPDRRVAAAVRSG